MAIERGVDEVDIDELGIEDNSKEIVIGEASFSDEIIDNMGDEDIQTMVPCRISARRSAKGSHPLPRNFDVAILVNHGS